jgi:pimeloyl-ACP methyl ester carboxylesterase
MAVFILVHGGAHGGWCWSKVVAELRNRGHLAVAPDLPGMGKDRTPLREITLRSWAEFIADRAREAGEPAVLVGHSRGGPVISEAAELAPEVVLGLIYVTAVLPLPGTSTMDAVAGGGARRMTESATMTADGVAITMDREVAREFFYNRAEPKDAEAALDQLCPEPIAPNREPLTITPERWGRLPRAFIECTDDRTLPLELQRRMYAALACDPIMTLDSDHSPFLCKPGELTEQLAAIAAEFARRRSSS